MLTKADITFIRSLSKKSVRDSESLFVVEGEKMAREVVASSFKIRGCYVTSAVDAHLRADIARLTLVEQIERSAMERISSLKSATPLLMLVEKPSSRFDLSAHKGSTILALDGVQDPGNLGTIIRLADWFGISAILCSPTTADLYNPKVIQSTMGAVLRISVYYVDLEQVLVECQRDGRRVYGTFLEGRNLYGKPLCENSVIVFGSEGSGISSAVESFVDEKITIPSFGSGECESLNVAVAAAIVCSELRRG